MSTWTYMHGSTLATALKQVLGEPEAGTMAFIQCLAPDIVKLLANDDNFKLPEWKIRRVADSDRRRRTITADQAVELREAKGKATLLLVDTGRAGAGMDGIFNAALEVREDALFRVANRLAAGQITKQVSSQHRKYAETAVKRARGFGGRFSLSPWTVYDFYCRIAASKQYAGAYLHLLGLWPVAGQVGQERLEELGISERFVAHLFDSGRSGLTPVERIDALRLVDPEPRQLVDLKRFVFEGQAQAPQTALANLADKRNLWINKLRVEEATEIRAVVLQPWRGKTGKVLKWSGLTELPGSDELPRLLIDPDPEEDKSKLEVRWKTLPAGLSKGKAHYRVAVVTTIGDEELVHQEVVHRGIATERCTFTGEDFADLPEDAVVPARVVVSVAGSDSVEAQETEEFEISFGQPVASDVGPAGKVHRTFVEGLIELGSREEVARLTSLADAVPKDAKGYLSWRSPTKRMSFRVERPPLIREVEDHWRISGNVVGRWQVSVRRSGERVGDPKFLPYRRPEGVLPKDWARIENACKKMIDRFGAFGGVGQVYDDTTRFAEVKEYLRAWTAFLYETAAADPTLALSNTIEVQSQSGRLIGLIVLPSHPLRVAWHVAYDNLVLHTAFEEQQRAADIRKEFSVLDGAMFPAMLPGLAQDHTFVFADTLGFHAVGMVPDSDKEPKATVSILRRALGDRENAKSGAEPRVGTRSADVLGAEILKYVECHDGCRKLHIHALRAGDGRTVARALGKAAKALDESARDGGNEDAPDGSDARTSFVLELYPSERTREAGIVGRFIAECQEKRRRRAGTVEDKDKWMLTSLSLPGGIRMPRLRWARKEEPAPADPAHLAIAFDTFESQVKADDAPPRRRPFHAFGLLSFFDRQYWSKPEPNWRSAVPTWSDGDKHPGDRTHTDRLMRLANHTQRLVTRSLGIAEGLSVLRTRISPEKEHSLDRLHRLADWVVTLDRNAGIEYFDSPNDNKAIYDAYVIDCVPEREDLGCLQLITSTMNLEEVRALLDKALDRMGLSRSSRNAEFLMDQLKALSGRLAIRLTGRNVPASELIALALVQANCTAPEHECWTSLRDGFFVPVDDVRDLLPPLESLAETPRGVPRPDIIYVTSAPRKGLVFQFIEVKYRRHLRTARSPEVMNAIRRQTAALRDRWFSWYGHDVPPSFRAIRRAKLARVLRFYADKARRHDLAEERYQALVTEIDRMIGKGAAYSFDFGAGTDLGWICCPEYQDPKPMRLSAPDADVEIHLFGPGGLPDLDTRYRSHGTPSEGVAQAVEDLDASESQTAPAQSGQPDLPSLVAPAPTASSPAAEALPALDEAPSDAPNEDSANTVEPTDVAEPAVESSAPSSSLESAVVLGTDRFVNGRVSWQLTVRGNPHLLVAGLPGMGKTTCLLNLCRQMLDAGIRPIIFSYHQDLDEKLGDLTPSIRFIDFDGLGFNPLDIPNRSSHRPYLEVAGALRDIFVAIYPNLGDLQGEAVRGAVKESFVEAGWAEPGADRAALSEPPFRRFYEILAGQERPDRGLVNLLVRLEELNDYGFFDVGQNHGSLWDSTQPTVIRIHRTQNEVLQNAFASLTLYGLYKDMFRRGIQDRITHAVIFDEAHRAARLGVIPTMAKECRKYGVSLVLASQEARDFHKSVFSAIANYLVLRLTDADAKTLIRNVADSRQEKALIDKIKQMRRFRALYFQEGKARPNHVDLLDYTDPV